MSSQQASYPAGSGKSASKSKKNQTAIPNMMNSMKSEIENILSGFLKECNIPFSKDVEVDQSCRDACYADAIRRGLDEKVISRALENGIASGYLSYRHLGNDSTIVFVAVWITLMTHIDNNYELYEDGLREFIGRFVRQEPQLYQALDQLAVMIREFSEHWGTIVANVTVTDVLDFLTSGIIDRSIKDMEVKPSLAPGFPTFTRRMSGFSRACCGHVFPPELDVKEWIQVTPDLVYFIDHVNDLFSFFKEELEGDSLNFISIDAKAKGITKIEALKEIADATAIRYHRASRLLQSCPEAFYAFREFCVGYVAFHSCSKRYKLDQLNLCRS